MPSTPVLVTLEDVRAARKRIFGMVVATPMFESAGLSELLGYPIWVKAENLQITGSFKVRGAFNAMRQLAESGQRATGYATFSAGNHAAAVAYAAQRLGQSAVVCMPPGAVAEKVEAVQRYGGEVVFTATLVDTCHQIADERGLHIVQPFDDPAVIAGQGTVGLELLDSLPESATDDLTVLVPVGGGGLVSGVAVAVKALLPSAKVIGFEPATANAVALSLRAGKPVSLPSPAKTLADGLAAPFAGAIPYDHIVSLVDDVIVVEEDAIADAVWPTLSKLKLLIEPAAMVPIAGILSGAYTPHPGSTVVLIASGGNVSRNVIVPPAHHDAKAIDR